MNERGPIELIEEAIEIFRNAGLATLGLYYIGSLPFVLAFLHRESGGATLRANRDLIVGNARLAGEIAAVR